MRRQGGQLLLGHVDDDLLIVVGHGELVPAERDIPLAQAQEPADADDDVANLAVLIDQRAFDLADLLAGGIEHGAADHLVRDIGRPGHGDRGRRRAVGPRHIHADEQRHGQGGGGNK